MLQRELDMKWLDWHHTEEELERAYGKVTYSRIGVISKIKDDALKLRLIHDLRRSGVNQRIQMRERVVLPRMADLITDILETIARLETGEDWECSVLDYRRV